jgi:hypothetical protein
MYFAAVCCSHTDTVPVVFSVLQSPSQHASQLQSNLISDFRLCNMTLKFNSFIKTNKTAVMFISICYSLKLDVPLCYNMYTVTPNGRHKKLSVYISIRSNHIVKCFDQHVVLFNPRHYMKNKLELHINLYVGTFVIT